MTRFYFRPLLVFSICALVLLATLIALGVWQLERRQWKLALIASMDRNMHVQPVSLDEPGYLYEEPETDYLHVIVHGRFEHAKEVYLFTSAPGGGAEYHVLTPLRTDDGRIYLVDRGSVPKDRLDPASRAQGQVLGKVQVSGYWHWPLRPGWFTPAPDLAHRLFYARSVGAIAALDRLTLAEPGLIEADGAPNPGGWPKGGGTEVDLPNNHLQYAITWFALAIGLIGVYLAYHRAQGRLGWRA